MEQYIDDKYIKIGQCFRGTVGDTVNAIIKIYDIVKEGEDWHSHNVQCRGVAWCTYLLTVVRYNGKISKGMTPLIHFKTLLLKPVKLKKKGD